MAFGFRNDNAMMGSAAGGAGGLAQGSDLEVIQTEVSESSDDVPLVSIRLALTLFL
jgi:nucleoporin NUP159